MSQKKNNNNKTMEIFIWNSLSFYFIFLVPISFDSENYLLNTEKNKAKKEEKSKWLLWKINIWQKVFIACCWQKKLYDICMFSVYRIYIEYKIVPKCDNVVWVVFHLILSKQKKKK